MIDDLYAAHQENPNDAELDLRLSFDRFHAEKIAPKGDFEYVMNLLAVYRRKYKDSPDFKLGFHSMWEDRKTMEKLLDMLPVAERKTKDAKTEIITLDDGFTFEVRWKRLFYSDTTVDMHDTPVVDRNAGVYDEDINTEHGGNMSVVFNKEGEERGADFLIHYDGTILNWGATAPDNEPSIYTHTYAEVMQQIFDDVIGLSFLEKGNDYRDKIIAEVNPQAVARAKAMNLRDFYSRVVLEESKTRLYLSIRVIQDYIKEGRVPAETVESWPAKVKQLVVMSQADLIENYNKSTFSIVSEYLQAPNITADQLVDLYRLIRLGHYDVSPREMIEIVEDSNFPEKEEFYRGIAKEISSRIRGGVAEFTRQKGLEKLNVFPLDASRAVYLSPKELAIARPEILNSLPPDLSEKFAAAFDFLMTSNLARLSKGEQEIDGENVYAEVLEKPGKGLDGATSEIHFDHIDIQTVVSEAGDLIGLNSRGTASLDGSTPDPKREGLHLTTKSDQWRKIEPGEIVIILPLTPHAPGGIDKDITVKRVVVKVKV